MIITRAPLRVPLGGGGTDLPSYYQKRGGFILSAAINRYVYIFVNRPSADDLVRVKYSQYEEVSDIDQVRHDLVRPTLELLGIRKNVEITSMADVPAGTGLGSSGAYLVALLAALHELKRGRIPTQALAEMACHIEMDMAGHAVGKHDHYLAAFGGITCLEIDTTGHVRVSPLDLKKETAEDLRSRLLLFFTGIRRSAGPILEAQRSDTHRAEAVVMESLHRTKDLGIEIKAKIEAGDLDGFGALLDAHWQNKKKRSSLITEERIDRWYQIALDAGALGGKITGAGGGGFLVLYCPPAAKAAVRRAMTEAGLREMPYDFDFDGAKVIANI